MCQIKGKNEIKNEIKGKSKNFEVRITVKIETGDHFMFEPHKNKPFKSKRQYEFPMEVFHIIEEKGFSVSPETMSSHSSIILDDMTFKPNLKS